MKATATRILVVAGGLLWSMAAISQTERAGSSANTQLMRQMQQLASERTQLQSDNARLKQELDATRKERDALKGTSAAAEKRLRSLEAGAARAGGERDASTQELAQLRARMEELVGKFRETATALRDVETQRATAVQNLVVRDNELAQCGDRNQKLYTLNDEILTYFGGRGFWSGLASAEPFTKLKRTQLENLIGEYRDKAEDQVLSSRTP
jgi:chromosome segregation ATPase